jgi:serine/threonine protein kinase
MRQGPMITHQVTDLLFILLYSLISFMVYKLLIQEEKMDDKERGYEGMERREARSSDLLAFIICAIVVGFGLLYGFYTLNIPRQLTRAWKAKIRPDFIAQSEKAIIKADPGYKDLKWLGAGNLGDVYRLDDESDKKTYVVKVIDLLHVPSDHLNKGIREAQLLYYLRGKEGIIQLQMAHLWDNKVFLKEEYMDGGSLNDYFFGGRLFGTCSVKQASAVTKQILKALVTLHELHIIHRDIKPANIMLNSAGDAKLIDFGLGTRPYVEETAHWGQSGSLAYAAPEFFWGDPFFESADIWSLGASVMSLYTIVHDISSTRHKIRSALLPILIKSAHYRMISWEMPPFQLLPNHEMRDFCEQCMRWDHRKRPTARQLLSHPFIVNAGSHWDVAALVASAKTP